MNVSACTENLKLVDPSDVPVGFKHTGKYLLRKFVKQASALDSNECIIDNETEPDRGDTTEVEN